MLFFCLICLKCNDNFIYINICKEIKIIWCFYRYILVLIYYWVRNIIFIIVKIINIINVIVKYLNFGCCLWFKFVNILIVE